KQAQAKAAPKASSVSKGSGGGKGGGSKPGGDSGGSSRSKGGSSGSGDSGKADGGGGESCDVANSFVPGTKVLMADGSSKLIEEVEVGDKVVATDPEAGETRIETVTAEIKGEGLKHLVKIVIDTDGDNGEETAEVTATDGHPFWVPELGQWLDATDLQPGQWLQTSAGTYVQITAVERRTNLRTTVHNLTVGDTHTYYALAGNSPLVVHNDNCPSISSSDVQGLYERANSLYSAYGQDSATVAVARVWNRSTGQTEDWVATHLSDMPAAIRNNLGGASYKFGEGHAEATIVGALGDQFELLGIASSTRMCPGCYDALKGLPGMMETTIGRGSQQLPSFTRWRTAVNTRFWDGT
ncbi:Hint domain-containing protein, partial [Streptomyces griseoincarnatus]